MEYQIMLEEGAELIQKLNEETTQRKKHEEELQSENQLLKQQLEQKDAFISTLVFLIS
jgi:septal ring factor EnvC (AmiA/AmiB activator)